MRQLRADVSHRIRRRRPSIFAATWFRLLLGGGLAVILGLVLGPAVAGWLRTSPARGPVVLSTGAVATTGADPGPTTNGAEPPSRTGPSVPGPPAPAAPAMASAPPPAGPGTTAVRTGPKAVVFRIQVGAFLDHRNADRLIQRLRGDNLEVADSILEASRVLYRVLAQPRDGEDYDSFLERLRGLGFTPETTDDGALVTAPVPLHAAVEASRRLRESEVRVRLERSVSAAAFRVVRVGRFVTWEEAERARTELAGRGVEGFVVREP